MCVCVFFFKRHKNSFLFWKALGESDLIEFYFTIFRANVWKILIFEWILLLEIQKKLQKLGLER
jgi:hypothetical protein